MNEQMDEQDTHAIEVAAKISAAFRKHALITPAAYGEAQTVDILRISDIYRRAGHFQREGYDDALAEEFVTLAARFVGAAQTIYDPHYARNRPYNTGYMAGCAQMLAALSSNGVQHLPDILIMPMSAEADLDGSVQAILDRVSVSPRRSHFRMVLADKPYQPDVEITAIGAIIPERNKKTAFPLKKIRLVS